MLYENNSHVCPVSFLYFNEVYQNDKTSRKAYCILDYKTRKKNLKIKNPRLKIVI